MGTLASKAEIGVWVDQAPGAFLQVRVYQSRKNVKIIYAKSCNLVAMWPENGFEMPSIMRS